MNLKVMWWGSLSTIKIKSVFSHFGNSLWKSGTSTHGKQARWGDEYQFALYTGPVSFVSLFILFPPSYILNTCFVSYKLDDGHDQIRSKIRITPLLIHNPCWCHIKPDATYLCLRQGMGGGSDPRKDTGFN